MWKDLVGSHRSAKADALRVQKAIWIMSDRSKHSAFARWVEFVEQCEAQRSVLERVAARMRNVKLAASFAGWAHASSTAVHQRVVVQRALARLSQREVAGAFGRWQEQVLAARDTARAVAKAEKFFLALKNHASHQP